MTPPRVRAAARPIPSSAPELTLTSDQLDPVARRALELMDAPQGHVLLTGRAGTGKTSLINYLRAHTAYNVIVVAPTGVAAVHIQGQTIHSLFGFPPHITPDQVKKRSPSWRKMFQHLDILLIDEISMVRADLLDCVDRCLRLNGPNARAPFGGIKTVMVGDWHQLPPVVTQDEAVRFTTEYPSPFFFDAKCFAQLPVTSCELTHIHRQSDQAFIRLLDHLRVGSLTEDDFTLVNNRLMQGELDELPSHAIILTTTNRLADAYNQERLSRLSVSSKEFHGTMSGDFPLSYLPTASSLSLKVGAQVMLLTNDPLKRWVNGDLGTLQALDDSPEGDGLVITLANGKSVTVPPYTWKKTRFYFDPDSQEIEEETVGSFTQYPVRLAWAITIHKSQGKTYDKVVIDFGSGTFAPGQAYVALSRCRSLEGIILMNPLTPDHIMVDPRVQAWMARTPSASETLPSSL